MWISLVAAFFLFASTDLQPVRVVAPEYPPLAFAARVQGEVKVSIGVDLEGHPTIMDVIGNRVLQEAAKTAVMEWQFAAPDQPRRMMVTIVYKIEGKAVPRDLHQSPKIVFQLPDRVEITMSPVEQDDAYPSIPMKKRRQ